MKYIAALTMSALLMALPLSAAQKAHKKLPINHPAGSVARVGQKAPDFSLTDIDGKRRTLQELKRHFQIDRTFPGLYSSYGKRKVIFVAINSADSGRALLATRADFVKEWRAHSPILIDSGGTVGKIYGAKSSPHIFVVGSDGIIKYAGAIDNDTKGEKAGAGQIDYLVLALDEILAGKPVTEAETDPYGCRIKYSR
jgi:hypothetical protein